MGIRERLRSPVQLAHPVMPKGVSSEYREHAMEHPRLDLRARDDLLEVVVAHDGRVLGGFEAKLLRP
jgi:hypothetical protein